MEDSSSVIVIGDDGQKLTVGDMKTLCLGNWLNGDVSVADLKLALMIYCNLFHTYDNRLSMYFYRE